MRATLVLLAAAAAAAALLPSVLAQEAAPPAKSQKPFVTWWGPDSRITKREFIRVTDGDQWRTLWARHMDLKDAGGFYGPPIPEIDFTQCMVVGVFEGWQTNTRGLTAVSVTEEEERVVLRYDWQSRSYQTSEMVDRVTPFGIFVLPRSGKPLVIEVDTNGLKDRGPSWKERARFERL